MSAAQTMPSDGTTLVARSPSRLISVTGDDRLGYLDAVLSQHLEGLADGEVGGWLELDAHGRPLAAGELVRLDDRVLLLVDEELVDEVVERLGGRTFLADARFAADPRAVLAVRGPAATEVVAAALGAVPAPGAAMDTSDVTLLATAIGVDVATPDADRDLARLAGAGARTVGPAELEGWRIRAGVPRWGREITPPHLPEELGLLPTHVHLAKGCYPGQEAVARMWMLGRPRRRLARVRVEGSVVAGWEAGSGRARATVTSCADGRGLAFVPTDAEPGARIEGQDGAIAVLDLVGDDLPVRGHDPNVQRRRDRDAVRR